MRTEIVKPARGRCAFTLVELLVSLGILAVVIGLAIPAVQAARERARTLECTSNLRQMIAAVHQFESVNGRLPPQTSWGDSVGRDGVPVGFFSMHCLILPFLERRDLYDAINFSAPTLIGIDFLTIQRTAAASMVQVFLCPSDRRFAGRVLAPNSYRVCIGVEAFRLDPWNGLKSKDEGAFNVIGLPVSERAFHIPSSAIADGLSQTLAFSEKPIGSGTDGPPSLFRDWLNFPGPFIVSADGSLAACASIEGGTPLRGAGWSWMDADTHATKFYAAGPPNTRIPDCSGATVRVFSARSYHPGGVNAAMVDGSVRWFRSSIAVAVWRALGTRAGGEVVGDY